ncbi:hypothetical protein AAZX31_13G115100 [Glycine max]
MSCECVESEKSVTLLLDEDQNKISFGEGIGECLGRPLQKEQGLDKLKMVANKGFKEAKYIYGCIKSKYISKALEVSSTSPICPK